MLRSGLGVATYQASSTRRTSNTIGSIQFPLFGAERGLKRNRIVERKPRLVAVDETVVRTRKKLGFIPDIERNELAGVY